MTERAQQGAKSSMPGLESMSDMTRGAFDAYERTLNLVRSWYEGLMATYREQADSYAAMLQSVDKSLAAMEQVVENQVKTTRALSESLDASRHLLDTAIASNKNSTERVETFVDDALQIVRVQADAVRTQVEMGNAFMAAPSSAPAAAYLKMVQDWTESYGRLLASSETFGSAERRK